MKDEWEWPADCKAQREMESHLRCEICGDFFHGPVLLACSHTFCSACVRRFLQSKGANGCCPSCKQPCTSRDLVPNRALEQVTLLFENSKQELLKRLQGITVPSSATCTSNAERGKIKKMKHTPERMPLMSYSVMRDKEVRKLLDSINIRIPTKNRDEIIQIHKEVGEGGNSCSYSAAHLLGPIFLVMCFVSCILYSTPCCQTLRPTQSTQKVLLKYVRRWFGIIMQGCNEKPRQTLSSAPTPMSKMLM